MSSHPYYSLTSVAWLTSLLLVTVNWMEGAGGAMRVTKIGGGCEDSTCPTVYATDRDTLVVQGYVVEDAEALAGLNLPAGESAVEIPRSLLEALGDGSVDR